MRSLLLVGSLLASSLVAVAQDGIVRNMLIRGTNTTAANIGTVTVPTLTGPRTFTFPDLTGMVGVVPPGSTGFVEYGLSLPQDVLVANGTARLFDVRYNGSPTGAAQGARIHSSSAGAAAGTSANGLQIFAIAAGGGVSTSTALSLSATGGVFNNALVVDAGDVRVIGGATFLQATTLGSAATDAIIVNGEIRGASPLSFEGATDDNVRTTFAITDPTVSRTITFPNASGTVALVPATVLDYVAYGTTAPLNTAVADGATYLFDVAYNGAASGDAIGARIVSTAAGGLGDRKALGLRVDAIASGISAMGTSDALGIDVTAQGQANNTALSARAEQAGANTNSAVNVRASGATGYNTGIDLVVTGASGLANIGLQLYVSGSTGDNYALFVSEGTLAVSPSSIPDAADMTSRELVAYNTGSNILERVTIAEAIGGTPVLYGVAAPQSTLGNGAQHLFNLEYSSTISVPAVGARIASVTNIGTAPDANATGLTVVATTNGTGTATALSVGASGGSENIAVDVTEGNFNTSVSSVINAGGVVNTNGRLNVNNIEVHTPPLPVNADASLGDIVLPAFTTRYVKINVTNTIATTRNVTFPAGVDGQRLTTRISVVNVVGGATVTFANTRVTDAGAAGTATDAQSGQVFLNEWIYDTEFAPAVWVLLSSVRID